MDMPKLLVDYGVMWYNGKNVRCCLFECKYCGEPYLASYTKTKNGHKQSCGCLYHNRNDKSDHPLYNTYMNMRNRCENPNATGYKYAGEKGLSVCIICEEWKNLDLFIAWALDNGWSDGDSKYKYRMHRKDRTQGYSPDNCYFAEVKKKEEKVNDSN